MTRVFVADRSDPPDLKVRSLANSVSLLLYDYDYDCMTGLALALKDKSKVRGDF